MSTSEKRGEARFFRAIMHDDTKPWTPRPMCLYDNSLTGTMETDGQIEVTSARVIPCSISEEDMFGEPYGPTRRGTARSL